MPSLDEINAAAPETPVFIMHLYDRALLNGAALRALGYDKHAPEFPAGEVQRDRHDPPPSRIGQPYPGVSRIGGGGHLEQHQRGDEEHREHDPGHGGRPGRP